MCNEIYMLNENEYMHLARHLTHTILNYSTKYKINRIDHKIFKTQLEFQVFHDAFHFFQAPACADLPPCLSGRSDLLLCLAPV